MFLSQTVSPSSNAAYTGQITRRTVFLRLINSRERNQSRPSTVLPTTIPRNPSPSRLIMPSVNLTVTTPASKTMVSANTCAFSRQEPRKLVLDTNVPAGSESVVRITCNLGFGHSLTIQEIQGFVQGEEFCFQHCDLHFSKKYNQPNV